MPIPSARGSAMLMRSPRCRGRWPPRCRPCAHTDTWSSTTACCWSIRRPASSSPRSTISAAAREESTHLYRSFPRKRESRATCLRCLLGPRFRGDERMLLHTIATRSIRASPVLLEAGLEALGEVAGWRLAHRAGDAERSAEQLLLGAQRAQPLVVAARNVGAERQAGVGRQEVEAQRLAGGPTLGVPRRVRQRPCH